jgi:Flp pilus assembly pilin Flp
VHSFAPTSLRREEGQTMAEYGVILAVITATIIGALLLLSGNIETVLNRVASAIK